MDMRELKALEIAARSRITCADGVWSVPSQNGNGSYRVVIWASPSCTCEDFELNCQGTSRVCKHIVAARLVAEREHGKPAAVIVDTPPKKPNYPRNWKAINEAHSTEQHRFQELLFDLVKPIPDRPPQRVSGRRPHKVRDMLFSLVYKVYSGFSSRRFSCDILDAKGRGYMTVAMPGIKVSEFFGDEALTPILSDLVRQSARPLATVESEFSVDSTGFSSRRLDRWFDQKYGTPKTGRAWVKAHVCAGVKTNVVTAAHALEENSPDCPQFAELVSATAHHFKINEVSADKAYLSRENLELVERLGGTAFIPFKSNSQPGEPGSLWERMFGYFQFRREEFLGHYHKRSNVETTFSMCKARFGDGVRSKTDVAMRNEVYAKFIAHNLCCLVMEQCELGIDPVFWPGENGVATSGPDVVPFKQPG